MDLIETPRSGENAPEFSVSEISGAVKRVIEGEFGRVRVRGEVGRVYMARSGHLYFDIKDDRNVLAAVSWKGQVAGLTARPEEGMEVLATGKLTTFGSQSKYQLNVEDLVPAGEGALMAMLEKRKKALAAEGLFDEARKRPLPLLPEVIGVITSPTGAVIRDILHRLRERFPRKVLVWPVAVQGQACAGEVARAIEGFNRLTPGGSLPRPDLLIVARGGGSIEDLWGFNEEIVARAAAASQIPLISAVGHETDTTLIDFVSDKRAPTPTAAAEIAVPVRMEMIAWSDAQGARMVRALTGAVEARGQRLRDLARGLPRPEALMAAARQRLDMAEARLPAPGLAVMQRRQKLAVCAAKLSPVALAQRVEAQARHLAQAERGMQQALRQPVQAARSKFDKASARLSSRPVQHGIAQGRARLATLSERAERAIRGRMEAERAALSGLGRMHETLGYKETLRRGYAVVHGEDGLLTSARAARQARRLEVEFADGRLALGGKAARPRDEPPGQGSLF